jgi:glycosyltransferase involved in cell wall biosynthesis
MKVLMLTPYLPYPLLSGGQIRTYNLLKKLAKKHEVTLFALIKEDNERQYIPELEKYCSKVKVFKRSRKPFTLRNIFKTGFSSFPFLVMRNHVPETIKAVQQELENEHYDLIHAETFYMMPHIPPTTIPTILVEQTIEYLGYESYAKTFKWHLLKPLLYHDITKIKKWENFYWNSCTKLIVMSENDRQYISQYITDPSKIEVVSNGVDTSWFSQKAKALPTDPTILSVGTFKWLPNVEATSFLVEEVWPLIKAKLPQAKLWIVGNAPTPRIFEYQKKDTSITVTGGIPDIRDAFNGAHVLVAPVFSGKGTRYKILEAMASETPIVATDIAVEGLGVEDGTHVLTSNSAQGLADSTVSLLKDPPLRKKLAANGKIFVTQHYDWTPISQKLDQIYQTLGTHGHVEKN